jgi:hypothetical protein
MTTLHAGPSAVSTHACIIPQSENLNSEKVTLAQFIISIYCLVCLERKERGVTYRMGDGLTGAVDFMLKELQRSDALSKAMFDATRPELLWRETELERIRKLMELPEARWLGSTNLGAIYEQEQQRWRELAQPLENLRVTTAFNQMVAKATEVLSVQGELRKMMDQQRPWESFSASLRTANDLAKKFTQDLALAQSSGLADIAKSFGTVDNFRNIAAQAAASLTLADQQAEWVRQFRLPVIDSAAAATIAHLWGRDGLERQLQSLGLDYERLLQGAIDEDQREAEPRARALPSRLPVWDVLNILMILLAVLVPIWQKLDADRAEDRLTNVIRDGDAENQRRMEGLERLLKEFFESLQPQDDAKTHFVVRTRFALVREEPRSGSRLVAQVFPNQVVTLLSERGKWIEVEYFDWLAQEERSGWCLKKYFERIPFASKLPPAHGIEPTEVADGLGMLAEPDRKRLSDAEVKRRIGAMLKIRDEATKTR